MTSSFGHGLRSFTRNEQVEKIPLSFRRRNGDQNAPFSLHRSGTKKTRKVQYSNGEADARRQDSFVLRADAGVNGELEYGKELDVEALLKYATAAVVQLSCFAGAFCLLDKGLDAANLTGSVPSPVVGLLFYAISLKSRVFNPLNNQRPDLAKAVKGDDEGGSNSSKGFGDRVMPTWTPPGVVFPIMWVLIIGPIRAYSSSLVVEANSGTFLTPETIAFIFHLTVGDIWNTINNTEQRYGAAVVGVLAVVASALFAADQYYQILPLAGKTLGATALWLVTASALIADTWRLNPDSYGNVDVLYPTKQPGTDTSLTTFAWFAKDDE